MYLLLERERGGGGGSGRERGGREGERQTDRQKWTRIDTKGQTGGDRQRQRDTEKERLFAGDLFYYSVALLMSF